MNWLIISLISLTDSLMSLVAWCSCSSVRVHFSNDLPLSRLLLSVLTSSVFSSADIWCQLFTCNVSLLCSCLSFHNSITQCMSVVDLEFLCDRIMFKMFSNVSSCLLLAL